MKTNGIYRLLILILSVTFFVSLSSAATKSSIGTANGVWKIDTAGKKNFEQPKVLSGYTYYYTGTIEEPDSVMALSDKCKLHESRFWAKTDDMADRVLRGWLQAWKNNGQNFADMYGGTILDPKGNTVGYWISYYPLGAVKVLDNGEFQVFQPMPTTGPVRPGQGS